MAEPKRNTAFTAFIALSATGSTDFQAAPTLAAGDFQVSTDSGALVNLATLPVVAPAGSVIVQVDLTAAEMDGNSVNVVGIDVAGAQWEDILLTFDLGVAVVDTIHDGLYNNSTVVVGGGGDRTITVFADDQITEIAKVNISADGLVRTKLSPTP